MWINNYCLLFAATFLCSKSNALDTCIANGNSEYCEELPQNTESKTEEGTQIDVAEKVTFINEDGEEKEGQKCKIDADGNCIQMECIDRNENCGIWAAAGECGANPKFMLNFCRKTCDICDFKGNLTELIEHKRRLDKVGGDEMLLENSFGMNQTEFEDSDDGLSFTQVEQETADYMENVIFSNNEYANLRDTCKNRNKSCARWTALGECEKNPTYMQKMCAPSCRSCDVLDPTFRCPIDKTAPKALPGKGHLNALFERIVTAEEFKKYNPTILSQPKDSKETANTDETETADDKPWVITLDNFVSPEECDRLIQLGHDKGYERSADTGKRLFDGTHEKFVNDGRTSTNIFCTDECNADPATHNVTARMESLTGIGSNNYEFLQLLRYEPGQFYNTHHDFAKYHLERQFGPRILTLFLYLNDVEEGGATNFPNLGFDVKPVKGKALLWPSVKDEEPETIDRRTMHGALHVIKGVKYAANVSRIFFLVSNLS